jgi:hypothetical protein
MTLKVLIGFFILVLTGISWFYFNQEKWIFFPETLNKDFKFNFVTDFKEKNLKLKSGEIINYLIFNDGSEKGSVLYFHGNAGSLKDWGLVASEISKRTGWEVVIMDFPGYGKSTGNLPKNHRVLVEMGRALRNEILNKNSERPFILFGRSIGTGIAVALAAEKKPSGLILETPYRSFAKLGREFYPFLPESFSRFDLDNEKSMKSFESMPGLILHGTNDSVIPFEHSKVLNSLNSGFELVAIEGGDHNNLREFPTYWPSVEQFLKQAEKQR